MTTSDKTSHSISIHVYDAPTAQARTGLKIVLLKLDHIGDFITAIPAFRLMRQTFKEAELTLICLPAVVAMAESTGLFNRVAGFTGERESAQLGKVPGMDLGDQIEVFRELLDGPYFLAADFKHDAGTRKWLDHIDAEVRAGFTAPTRKGLDILLPAMEWDVPPANIPSKDLPVQAELRLTLLAHAIADTLFVPPLDVALFPSGPDVDKTPAYRTLAEDKRLKIGVSLGAGSELRQWRSDYWALLLQKLVTVQRAQVIFFGGPGDKSLTDLLMAHLPPGSFTDLTAAFPLAVVPAYMKLLDAYIGCDTGLTHLAAGLGLPTVNIFAGISNVSVWRARGPKVKTVYAAVACAPCHLRFKRECPNNNVCMTVIMPDMVYACFEQVMTSR